MEIFGSGSATHFDGIGLVGSCQGRHTTMDFFHAGRNEGQAQGTRIGVVGAKGRSRDKGHSILQSRVVIVVQNLGPGSLELSHWERLG